MTVCGGTVFPSCELQFLWKDLRPANRLLRLNQYQLWMNGLKKLVVDDAGEIGYRRSVAIFTAADVDAPPFRIAHEWLLCADCDKLNIFLKVLEEPRMVFADGAEFKSARRTARRPRT